MISRIEPFKKLDDEVHKLADTIFSKSSLAVLKGKSMFYKQLEKNVVDAYTLTEEIIACNIMAEDAKECIDAFEK